MAATVTATLGQAAHSCRAELQLALTELQRFTAPSPTSAPARTPAAAAGAVEQAERGAAGRAGSRARHSSRRAEAPASPAAGAQPAVPDATEATSPAAQRAEHTTPRHYRDEEWHEERSELDYGEGTEGESVGNDSGF